VFGHYHIITEELLYRQIDRDLFGTGASAQPDRVGLEVELIPFREEGGVLVPVSLAGPDGLLRWLETVAAGNGWTMETDAYGSAVIDCRDGGRITLEPAGQIEYSTAVADNPALALAGLNRVVDLLEEEGSRCGIQLIAAGYNSFCPEEQLKLEVGKPRYQIMDRHFAQIGQFGRKMMRATCSLQINLDFGSPEIASERWRLANMIAPSMNAIFANSPYIHDGLRYRSFRYEIWRRTDPTRTGRLYDRPDLDPIADYLRFALNASVMLIGDGRHGCMPPPRPMTFREWLADTGGDRRPTLADWRLHLTTLFPDVRPKGWMELRSIDCLPRQWWAVPVAVAATLLYDDAVRRLALTRLELTERQIEPGEHEHGGAWRSDFDTGRMLVELALPRIKDRSLAGVVAEYHAKFTSRGRTPGDEGERDARGYSEQKTQRHREHGGAQRGEGEFDTE
jgi:glutamate--cysteine ligase